MGKQCTAGRSPAPEPVSSDCRSCCSSTGTANIAMSRITTRPALCDGHVTTVSESMRRWGNVEDDQLMLQHSGKCQIGLAWLCPPPA